MDAAGWTVIVAAFAGMVAAVTTVVTYRMSKQQLTTQREITRYQTRVDVISKSRRQWIDQLRDEIAGFISETENVWRLSNPLLPSRDAANESKVKSIFHKAKAELLLNPSNPEDKSHKELIALMDRLVILAPSNCTSEALTAVIVQLVEKSQEVLKDTWETVKDEVEKWPEVELKKRT